MGKVEKIFLKRAHRGVMDSVAEARFTEGKGLAGNVDRSRNRQVTILELENWERFMAELHANLDPAARRANLVVSGIRLEKSRGRILNVGTTRLLIGGEVTPCERMDEALPGLRDLMRPNWGGGAFARVLDNGVVKVGDSVSYG